MEPNKKDPNDYRYNQYIPIYRQHSDGAGYFYSNIVTSLVKVFGFTGRYQQGTSAGTKREFWYINDEDANGEVLPTEGMGVVEGPAITKEEWNLLKSSQMGTATPQPTAVPPPAKEVKGSADAPF